ncbi:hypothetical protein HDU93_007942 [Gonapodya sp. JEL0774]|nr:hypothetical protein HDU93_007942 [Gonapodya sp. JEL0774]
MTLHSNELKNSRINFMYGMISDLLLKDSERRMDPQAANELLNERERQLQETEKRLETEIQVHTELKGAYTRLQDDYAHVEEEFSTLQQELESHRKFKSESESKISALEDEVRKLRQEQQSISTERDKESSTLRELREENRRLQQSLEDSNSQIATLKVALAAPPPPGLATSKLALPTLPSNPEASLTSMKRSTSGGLFPDQNLVMAFNNAAQELRRSARSDQPTAVLVAMKSIVVCCKNLTEGTDQADVSLAPAQREALAATNRKISTALTNLMTATKTHATSGGERPGWEAMNECVTGLSNAVDDLVGLTSAVQGVSGGQRGSRTSVLMRSASTSSARGGNRTSVSPGGNIDDEEIQESGDHDSNDSPSSLEELKSFLEQKTDDIVIAIQDLLQQMRQTSNYGPELRSSITEISDIVEDLILSNRKLTELGNSVVEAQQSKSIKQKVAAASYEVAKDVKSLVEICS